MSDLRRLRERVTRLEGSKPGTLRLATAYAELGTALVGHDELTGARLALQSAVNIFERKSRKRCLKFANACFYLSYVSCEEGDWDCCRTYGLKAVKIYERTKPKSSDLAHAYGLLGYVADKKENFDEAYLYRTKELEIDQSNAPESLAVANTYVWLGALQVVLGDPMAAHGCFQKSLEIHQHYTVLDTAETYSYLAKYGVGDAAQDEYCYQQAMEIIRQLEQPRPLDLARVLVRLADYCSKVGNWQQAKDHYLSAREVYDEHEMVNCFSLAPKYFSLGWLCSQDGDNDDSLRWYHDAIRVYEAGQETQTFDFTVSAASAANAYFCVGAILDGQGEYTQSLSHYRSALDTWA